MRKLLSTIAILGLISFLGQVNNISSVSAAPGDPVDMNMYVGNMNAGLPSGVPVQNVWSHICAWGTGEPITSITFESKTENMDISSFVVGDPSVNNNATDLGSIDGLVWTGVLEMDQCLVINPQAQITGELGGVATWTFSILSATHAGDVAVVDNNLDNQSDSIEINVIEASDIALETRLLTSGDITAGSNVSYEVLIKNIAGGTQEAPGINVYYIMPQGAIFTNVEDTDTDDILDLVGCSSMGPAADLGPAFSEYLGDVMQCAFESSSGVIPGNSTFPIQFNMQASSDFASGTTSVLGVALAGDFSEPDSASFIMAFMGGTDAFGLDINNIMRLTYDAGELQVTINRCEGLGEVVQVDDACFTVSFNKLIWGPSFTEDDLVVDGGGSIYSFEQLDDYTWEVRLNGMTLGGTVRLLLGAESVIDYSAVLNGTEVLGINEIRYGEISSGEETPTENSNTSTGGSDSSATNGTLSATGSLPATGSTTAPVVFSSLLLMLAGAGLLLASKRVLLLRAK